MKLFAKKGGGQGITWKKIRTARLSGSDNLLVLIKKSIVSRLYLGREQILQKSPPPFMRGGIGNYLFLVATGGGSEGCTPS